MASIAASTASTPASQAARMVAAAAPDVSWVWKWMGSPVWSRDGIIAVAGVAGITSVLLVMMLSAPRVFLAMARDGLACGLAVGAVLAGQNFGVSGLAVSVADSDPWQWEAAAQLAVEVLPIVIDALPRWFHEGLAQTLDGRILVFLLITHLGLGHCLAHAGGGFRLGVAVEVDKPVLHGVSYSPASP